MPSKGDPGRRNDFVVAAQALFEEKGFENTSVDDIVARVGVAKGLFYYYFSSKEELLGMIMERLMDEIDSAIAAAMERKGLTALERFRELMKANADVTSRSKTLLRYFHQARNQACHLAMEQRGFERMVPSLERIIVQGVEEGAFNVPYPRETAAALMLMVKGVRSTQPIDLTAEQAVHLIAVMQHLTESLLGAPPGTFSIYQEWLPPELRPRHERSQPEE